MSKLMRNRWLRWSLLIGVLAALGVGIYEVEQPEPMCVIDAGKLAPLCLADEGRRLVTYFEGPPIPVPNGWAMSPMLAPVQVWDTRTGAERLREFKDGQQLANPAYSSGGRYVAVEPVESGGGVLPQMAKNRIVLVDTVGEIVRELPLQDSIQRGFLYFSPKGELLVRLQLDDEKLLLWDTASGRVLDEGFTKPGYRITFWGDAVLGRLPGENGGEDVEVWNVHERKKMAVLENVGPIFALSPDGRYFLDERPRPDGGDPNKWGVWNVATGRIEAEFQTERQRPGKGGNHVGPIISPDGRWVVMASHGEKGTYLEIRALPSGKQIATLAVNDLFSPFFSPDGQFLAVNGLDGGETFALLDVPSMKVLWKDVHQSGDMPFGNNGQLYVISSDPRELRCRDCATGELRARIWLPPALREKWLFLSMYTTPDRQSLLVTQQNRADPPIPPVGWRRWVQWLSGWRQADTKPGAVVVVDTRTDRTRLCIEDWRFSDARLSADGQTLVTVHDEADDRRLLYCWDVNAFKPLRYPIGIPASLAALCVLFAWWRNRRRAMAKSAGGG